MGAGASGPCERTLVGHTDWARALATWRGRALGGSSDESVRVWDAGTGAHDATLAGHTGPVRGLAVDGHRLSGASKDGTIREWALGTWGAVRTVETYGPEEQQFPGCLAAGGSKLLSGSQISSCPMNRPVPRH